MKASPVLLALSGGLSVAAAQRSSATITSAPSSTSSRAAQTHTVTVGANHDFAPNTTVAEVGDIIEFLFFPKNHSVVKAAFGYPCVPYNYMEGGNDTFFSGPMLSDVGEEKPVWTLEVNSTDPTFYYCSAPGSCIDYHMIGVINPNETWSVENQLEFLTNSTEYQLSPGEPWPDEGPPPSATSSSTSASPSATDQAPESSTPTQTAEPAPSGGPALSAGAIAGIAIGGFAAIVIAIALIYICGRKGGIEKGYRRSHAAAGPASTQMIEANYGGDPAKSPAPTSTTFAHGSYMDGAPLHHHHHRPTSPGAPLSELGSPHNSFMGQSSPGAPGYAFVGQDGARQHLSPPNSPPPPPIELPAHSEHR